MEDRTMAWQTTEEQKRAATDKIVRFFHAKSPRLERRDIVLIYNNAMDDAINALEVYARKNPQYTIGLLAASRELRRNFMLNEEPDDG